MKFRYAIIALIGIVVIAAWVTKPSQKDFNNFYLSHSKNMNAAPLLNTQDKFLYTINKVTVYMPVTIAEEQKQVATPQVQETYIGLFGKFWKTD